jgi:hypothetical protein
MSGLLLLLRRRLAPLVALLVLCGCCAVVPVTHALSTNPNTQHTPHAHSSRPNGLRQAFSSASGRKLTFTPELVIPDPMDATSILLQTNAIQSLSQRIRQCQANAALVRGSLTALRTFTAEQETARGNFPGPVPVVYCGDNTKSDSAIEQQQYTTTTTATSDADDDYYSNSTMQAIADMGADGVLIQVCGGAELHSFDDMISNVAWQRQSQSAVAHGLEPILEVCLAAGAAAQDDDDYMESLLQHLSSMGGGMQPVAVLLSITDGNKNHPDEENGVRGDVGEHAPFMAGITLPTIPKTVQVPIIGSVRTTAGDNKLHMECQRLRDAGFTGAVLRSDCIPGGGFRIRNSDLNMIGNFWSFCISDLKSTKSKAFSFRSKNNMETSLGTKWANYQKGVIESGALGDPRESYSVGDEGNGGSGNYKGFA